MVVKIVLVAISVCGCLATQAHVRGSLTLDGLTFDKVVAAAPSGVVVKFDKRNPSNANERVFTKFAELLADTAIWVAEVHADGDKDDVAARLAIPASAFPEYRLFKHGSSEAIAFEDKAVKHATAESLRDWVDAHTGVFANVKGKIEAFENLILEQAAKGKQNLGDAVTRAKEIAATVTDETEKEASALYVSMFEKVAVEGPAWVAKEATAVKAMMGDKAHSAKKSMLALKLSLLSSFDAFSHKVKDEF